MRDWELLKRFMEVMGKRLWLYAFAINGMIAFDAGFSIVTSNLTNRILNRIQNKSLDNLALDLFINIFIGVVVIIGWRRCTIVYNIEAQRATAKVREKVYSKALRLPQNYYDEHHTGEFISKIIYDVNKATDIYRANLRRLLSPVITVLIYIVYMMMLCWQLTLILVVFNTFMLLYNAFFMKRIKKLSAEMSVNNKVVTEKLMNLIQGISVLKMYSGKKKKVDSFVQVNDEFIDNQLKNNRINALLTGINELSDVTTSLIFLAVGIVFVNFSWAGIGDIVAIYVIYGSFAWNFKQIGRYIPEFANRLVYVGNVYGFLDGEEEKTHFTNMENSKVKPTENRMVNVENVSFGYHQNKLVLDGCSLYAVKGEKVAVVAESGRGKSTLIKLLLGLYEPLAGSICIAGKNFHTDGVDAVRAQIAYVPQSAYLFNVSIKENIAYGNPDANDEEIIAAAKKACAHDFIMKLEKGYDTLAGEAGESLSGGERQRIAIARALIKKAPVVIFDEATSALDNVTEEKLYNTIFSECKDTTMLIIAHRSGTISLSDRIVSL